MTAVSGRPSRPCRLETGNTQLRQTEERHHLAAFAPSTVYFTNDTELRDGRRRFRNLEVTSKRSASCVALNFPDSNTI